MRSTFQLFSIILFGLFAATKLNAQSISYSDLYTNSTFGRTTIDLTSKPVGTIEGAAGTSPTGAATYTMPIKCPQGTNGMVPDLSIVYNSQGGNGILGQGWNLSGLSAITRAGKDMYHDGKVAPVSYTNDDAFVLDGSRLSVATGNNGDNLATYHTELESYSVTTSYGSLGGGPQYFKVLTKDGTVMEFGNSVDSRIMSDDGNRVMMWRLNRVIDVNGNYLDYVYESGDRDFRIKEIKYTGNTFTGLNPYCSVYFRYGVRSDINKVYDGGYTSVSKYLLSGIVISVEGKDYKNYSLQYGLSKRNKSLLKVISEYVYNDGSSPTSEPPLNDTRFKYSDEIEEFSPVSTNIPTKYLYDLTEHPQPDIVSGDFDGDGSSEILLSHYNIVDVDYFDKIFNKHYIDFSVYKKSSTADTYSPIAGSGYSWTGDGQHMISFKQSNSSKSFVVSDFDGDGKDDLFFFRTTTIGTSTKIDKMDGTSIYYSRVGASGFYFDKVDFSPPSVSLPVTGQPHLLPGKNKVLLGDFDGDKRTDYLYLTESRYYYGGVDKTLAHAFVSFVGKSEMDKPLMNNTNPSLYDESIANDLMSNDVYVIDDDGDGKSEILIVGYDKSYIYRVSKSSLGHYYMEYVREQGYPTKAYHTIEGIGDFNGDGKSDLLTRTIGASNYWEIGYGTGKEFKGYQFEFFHLYMYQSFCDIRPADRLFIGDYDGDGKSDILHESSDCGNFFTKSNMNLYYIEGVGLDNKIKYNRRLFEYSKKPRLNSVTQVNPILTDVNGDGKHELSFMSMYDETMQTLYIDKDNKANLLEKVTDGLNRTTLFDHELLTKATGTGSGDFYKSGSESVYPVNNAQYPLCVVTAMKVPDGIGGLNTTNFKYENLRLHRAGRGLLGFEKVKTINENADIRTESVYSLGRDAISSFDFYTPYIKTSKAFKHSTNFPLSQIDNTIKFTKIGSGFCYKEEQTESIVKDLHQGVTTTTNNTFDADGNVTYSISTTTGGETFTSTSTNTFIATGGSSFMNRPSLSITTIKRGSQPTISTEQAFTYNAKGLPVSSVTKPSGGIYTTELTETMGYDAYGNLNHKTTHQHYSSSIPYTHYEYDDYGRFVKSEENTFGDKTYYTTHKFWGKPLTVKAVNGLTTTYTYDVWGKLSTANVPTGPGTSYTINYSDGWDIGTNQLYYTLVQDPSAPDVKTWYDHLGREVKTSKETFGGVWTSAYTSYNAKGSVQSSTNFHLATESPQTTTNTYDEYNRIKSSSSVSGTTEYEYVLGGGYTSTTVKLPDGTIKKTKADAIGKIVESTNGKAGTVVFDYDSRGNEISHKLKGAFGPVTTKITKKYDAIGFLNEMDDMDAGKFGYAYDRRGRIISALSPNSVHTEYDYDIADRLEEKNITKGGVNYKYEYKYFGADKGYRPKEVKVTGPDGIVTEYFDYNVGGGISTYIKDIKGTVFAKSYTYDAYNRPLSSTDNTHLVLPSTGSIFYCAGSGFGTVNQYDANGFLTKISSNTSPAKTLYEATAMNGSGQITAFKRPGAMSSYIDYTNNLPSYFSTGSTQDLTMNYDYRNGNLLSRREGTVTPPVPEESFTYDAVDRLSKSDVAVTISGVLGPVTTHSIIKTVFDSLMSGTMSYGRIVSKSDVGTYSYSGFPANAVKEIVLAPGSTVISHETQNIEYNLFDKTQTITEKIGGIDYEEKMLYDASQNRAYTQQSQGSSPTAMTVTRQRWYVGDYEKQRIAGNDQHIHYISSDAGLVAMVVKDAAGYHYYAVFTDHLGSIVKVTDEMGLTVAEQNYDAWGRERNPSSWDYDMTGTFAKPTWLYRGYTGHEMLPEYGLINMNGRIYDPANGRMLRPDNYVQDPLNTQDYNRYSYCWNNPLKYTDPSGDLVFALPYVTINRRGVDVGVTAGVGAPGVLSAQVTVGTGTSGNSYASIGGTVSGISGSVGWGTQSGVFASVGVGLGIAGVPGLSTNLLSASLGWSQRGGLYASAAGITISKDGSVSFDPSIGYTHSFTWNKVSIRGGHSTADIREGPEGIMEFEPTEIIGHVTYKHSQPYSNGPMASAIAISAILAADDATVVGVVDDIAIPFIIGGAYLYSIYNKSNMSYPKPWTYTYRPVSQDPIHRAPNGFDPENLPDNGGKWLMLGIGAYMIYNEYKTHVNNMQPLMPKPVDNTRVNPKFIPYRK